MPVGSVKFFNQGRGYGFITPEGEAKDVFLHITSIKASHIVGTVNEGDKLSFEVEDGPKGQHAVKVVRVKSSGCSGVLSNE